MATPRRPQHPDCPVRLVDAGPHRSAALSANPRNGAAHHALGLLLVREKRMAEAMPELEAAARLVPENARYGYVYGVGLSGTGRPKQAIEVLDIPVPDVAPGTVFHCPPWKRCQRYCNGGVPDASTVTP